MCTNPQLSSAAILAWLQAQQHRVPGIVEGLDDESMRRPVLASGWSCVGMIQHLTVMTRFWFEEVMSDSHLGDPVHDDFDVDPARSIESVLGDYRREVRVADSIVQSLPLETVPAWWPEGMFGDWRLETLHDVLLHVLVETACHAGHLDAARELIDGRTWDYELGRLADPE